MKITKVIKENGKEIILIEVKPKEYEAMDEALRKSWIAAPMGKEDTRAAKAVKKFSDAQDAVSIESFDYEM